MNARISALTFAMILFAAVSALGQGITHLHVRPGPDGVRRPHHDRIRPIQVKSHRVAVDIHASTAVTKVTQVFHNANGLMLEGTYLFPVPDAASITEFTMVMNGKEVRGEVLEKDKARKIYENIVRSMRDPALLEYVGRDLFKASVFPIPARDDVQISLTYVQELKREGGVVEFKYPLKTQAFTRATVGEVAVSVTINENAPIKSVFSSSHQINRSRKSETKVLVSFEGKGLQANQDFHLFYTLSESPLGLHVLSEKTVRDGGYFMMKLTPKIEFKESEIAPRDIVFVVDTSGSMQDDDKIEQAKSALIYGLRTLRPRDRFNIVTFATDARSWSDKLVEADRAAVAEAISWVKKIRASGGTNIDEALTTSLKALAGGERLPMAVFLTDGRPTVGESNEKSILARARKANGSKARIFVFGVGYDVNTRLLDLLAEEGKGARDYITTSGNLELALSGFFDKVAFPVLTDVAISVDGVKVMEVYPKNIPDLFKGSELTILGRYESGAPAVIKLTGKLAGAEKAYTFEKHFADKRTGKDFLAVLWAKRKVGYLWDQIRLQGKNEELKNEIVRLGKKFAIATPYTSILVTEDVQANRPGQPVDSGHRRRRLQKQGLKDNLGLVISEEVEEVDAAKVPRSAGGLVGESPAKRAVRLSLETKKMKEQTVVEAIEDAEHLNKIRLAGRSFTLTKSIWIDDALSEAEQNTEKAVLVKAWSAEYFDLLKQHEELGTILARLNTVLLKLGDKTYLIKPAKDQKKEASGQ